MSHFCRYLFVSFPLIINTAFCDAFFFNNFCFGPFLFLFVFYDPNLFLSYFSFASKRFSIFSPVGYQICPFFVDNLLILMICIFIWNSTTKNKSSHWPYFFIEVSYVVCVFACIIVFYCSSRHKQLYSQIFSWLCFFVTDENEMQWYYLFHSSIVVYNPY